MKKFKITYRTQRSKEQIIIEANNYYEAVGKLMGYEATKKNRYLKILGSREL